MQQAQTQLFRLLHYNALSSIMPTWQAWQFVRWAQNMII